VLQKDEQSLSALSPTDETVVSKAGAEASNSSFTPLPLTIPIQCLTAICTRLVTCCLMFVAVHRADKFETENLYDKIQGYS